MNEMNMEIIPHNSKENGFTNQAFQQDDNLNTTKPAFSNENKVWPQENGQVPPKDEDESCGWRFWRPAFLQQMMTPRAALFWLCWAASVQGMVVNGFVNVSISTLEKRYHLKSANTGLIAGSYDIAAVLCAIPVSYLGSRPGASKPRWMGWGLLLMGLGSFIFTIPHFAAPPYDPVNTNINEMVNASSTVCDSEGILSTDECVDHAGNWLSNFKHIFVLGSFLHGVGATPLYTLGIAYLDESVSVKMSSFYMGIFQTMAVIGPSFGYVMGGHFLTIFIDSPSANLEKIGINYESSLWLGAWWIGFLISGSLAFFVSWALLAFPAELPGAKEREIERMGRDTSQPLTYNFGKLRALPEASIVLLKNMPFITVTLAETAEGFMMSGFAVFLPKIIESQFLVTPSMAAMFVGIISVPAGGGGTFLGGWIVKKFKMGCNEVLKMSFVCSVICCIITCSLFFTCPNNPFVGVNVPYQKTTSLDFDTSNFNLTSTCNANCMCPEMSFDPVCGSDDKLYFSPCHAGCKVSHDFDGKMIFTDCICITNGTSFHFQEDFSIYLNPDQLVSSATRQPCTGKCKLLPFFLIVIFLIMLFMFLILIPSLSATLRLVPDSHRSLGLGLQWICVRLLGTIPGPIIFGIIVDQTCSLWQTTCDGSGSCRSYNNNSMGRAVVALGLGFRFITTLFYALSWWLYRKRTKVQQFSK